MIQNYDTLQGNIEKKDYYDLIVCNPPYFRNNQGKLSPSEFKNRCRFYMDSDFKKLLNSISYSLKKAGKAFVLIQSLEDHKIDILTELQSQKNFKILHRGRVRATDLYQLTKTET